MTNVDANLWWTVTLPQATAISVVRVTCCADTAEYLTGFTILVDSVPCASNVAITAGETLFAPCAAHGVE